MSSTLAQTQVLFNKSLKIYLRNRKALIKELFLPLITALSIYSESKAPNSFIPLQILFPLSQLAHVRSLMVDVVVDKAEKYKEYLKINGLSSRGYLLSILLFAYFKAFLYTIITCSGFLFINIELSLALDFFILYFFVAVALTHFALFLTTFFSSKQLCSDIGGFIFSVLSFVYYAALETKSPVWFYFSLMFPQNNLSYAILTWIEGQSLPELDFTTSTVVTSIIMDSIVYYLLFVYLDAIMPDAFGVKKKWNFCFDICRRKNRLNIQSPTLGEHMSFFDEQASRENSSIKVGLIEGEDFSSAMHHENFDNPEGNKRSVIIDNISKSFGTDKVIDKLSLMIYEKQIFCLLGHNGAGKTTTINILTGILGYDSGDVYYYDQNFLRNIDKLRRHIGLCCQQDILFGDLTVREHLELFAKIRGLSGLRVDDAVNDSIRMANLSAEAEKLAKNLSGGNQRKLSLAIASIGGANIIFLDEPTSGMDPNSRRVIWDLIKQMKNDGKTILLTTHHLDEADELADRLAIMSKGRLFALGRADYIKKKFGVGYHLFVSPDYNTSNLEKFKTQKDKINEIMSKYLIETKSDDKSTDTLKYLLPFTLQKDFPSLFEDLETLPGIKLNLQMNSLEDAFINIGFQEEALFNTEFNPNHTEEIKKIPRSMTQKNEYSFFFQLEAMVLRKYYFTLRSFNNLVLMVLPIVFVFIGTLFTSAKIEEDEDVPMSQDQLEMVKTFMFLFLVNFAYSLNTTIYCSFPVYEREHNIKYALRVMGCRTVPYWLGTFIFDFISINVINAVLLLLVYFLGLQSLIDNITLLGGTIFAYSIALVSSAYLYGFVFKKASTVYKSFAAFYFFVPYVFPSVILAILQAMEVSDNMYKIVQTIVFHVSPIFAFNDTIYFFALGDYLNDLNEIADLAFFSSITQSILFLCWLAFLYMALTILLEKKFYKIKVTKPLILDSQIDPNLNIDLNEINTEASRVSDPNNDDPIRISHLQKVYENGYVAVKDISFGVKAGEIFGLLGPNGAGKSTTFNISTAMIPRSGGDVRLKSVSVDEDLDDVFTDLGICPQFNPLWEDMKVDEHLYIFAKVKGVPRLDINPNLNFIMQSLQLKEHARKKAKTLSGGTKRKLCVGISLIGSPGLQFMDEPSTGLDPMAKRYLWQCLSTVNEKRRASTVLTTHSMEEAEALCGKIGIVVNGRVVCIGPLNYLKNKYGSGYKITLTKVNPNNDFQNLIQNEFNGAVKVNDAQVMSETFQIPHESFVFSKAFKILDEMKSRKLIQDFSIYNTTLEQLFIQFSKKQQESSIQSV